jgi:hypothetical protein
MDYDDPMTDIAAPRHDIPPIDGISGDPRGQEAILLDFQAKVTQDMVGMQNGINYLIQKVEDIPAQVTAGMVKPGAASWWQVCTTHSLTSFPHFPCADWGNCTPGCH